MVFNKQTSTMEVRIMGVCPLYMITMTQQLAIFRGEVPVFWYISQVFDKH